MKRVFVTALTALLILVMIFSAVSCQNGTTTKNNVRPDPSTPTEPGDDPVATGVITFSDTGVDVGETGAAYANGVLTITKPGSYTLTGSAGALGVVVTVEKTEQVELILDNASITNPNGPAINCTSADKLFVTAKEGTVNNLKDGTGYTDADGPNAAIYSSDDLTIRGEGTLNVFGLYKNGISSKNDIKIKDLTLTVDAYNTAVRGKGSVTIVSGNVTVKAGKDGLKSTEDQKDGKGFILIEDGTVSITANDDAMQAEISITIIAGKVTAVADGKITNAPLVDVAEGTLNANV